MNKITSFDVYKNVKTLINSSGDNVNYFCDLLKQLSKDESKRFVLNSSDSILDGIKLTQNPVLTDQNNLIHIATSLLKVYRSAYFPKFQREDSKSYILPTLLEDSLNQINKSNFTFENYNIIVNDLRKAAQSISQNTLQDNYGPLRPFVVDHLRHYQSELFKSQEISKLEWLEYSLSLLDVMKIHSIDSKKLCNKIIDSIDLDPELIKKLSEKSLFYLFNMDLSKNIRKHLDKYIKSIPHKDISTLIKHLEIVFDKYDKTTIETFIYSLMHKSKYEKFQGNELLEVLKNLSNLNERHNDKDLTNLTNKLLEFLYPKITQTFLGFSNQYFNYNSGNTSINGTTNSNSTVNSNRIVSDGDISMNNTNNNTNSSMINDTNTSLSNDTNCNISKTSKLNRDHIAFVFESYLTLLKEPSTHKYIQSLSNFILNNKDLFTPIHLVSMIETINKSINLNDVSKLQLNNEYHGMGELSNELTKYLLSELEKLEFNDLCEVLYSFPLYKNFQFYDILSNYPMNSNRMVVSRREENFKEKLMEIVRRRILFNLDNNDNKTNLLYSKYLVKTMIDKDFELNNYIKFNTNEIINKMSVNELVNTLNTTSCTNYNQEALNNILDNVSKRLDAVNKLEDIQRLIEKNRLMKNVDLNNKLFSILTYKSINSKNRYSNLLRSLTHLHYESDPSIVDTVFHYLNRYILYLSVYDAESLLNSMKQLKIINNRILEVLNHTYELNIMNTPNKVMTDLLCHLKDMRIRHEPLIRKFTDKLLSNFRNTNVYYIPDLISLTDSLSELSIPYNDLYIFLTKYLSTNVQYLKEDMVDKMPVNELVNRDNLNNISSSGNSNRFVNLKLREKIELMYSISNLGVVDQNLKTLYLSVIDQLYPENSNNNSSSTNYTNNNNNFSIDGSNVENNDYVDMKNKEVEDKDNKEVVMNNGTQMVNEENIMSTNMNNQLVNRDNRNKLENIEENDLLLKLYEIHLEFILNNIYNQEGNEISKRLERPSKVWFTGQELKSQKFKKSDTYATIKNILKSLNVKFESGVTEIYFCNFVIRDGDKPTVIYVVPEEDLLRYWTTSLDINNLIQNPDLSVGNSHKIIKNLKLSGYNVVELLQSRWDSNPSERVTYLKNQLNIN